MRWNSNCPPERANGRYPSSSSTIRSSRDSCAARVPPLPIRVSSSRRVTNYEFWIVVNHPLFTDERCWQRARDVVRSEEHTSELQSLMRISYAVFCLKKKTNTTRKKSSFSNL